MYNKFCNRKSKWPFKEGKCLFSQLGIFHSDDFQEMTFLVNDFNAQNISVHYAKRLA